MRRLRLDAGADDVADQAVDRRRDPGIVAGIPAGPPRRRGRACKDRGVQAIDRLGAFPATAAARGVEGARLGDPEKALDKAPHAADSRPGGRRQAIQNVWE
jgi:hypothetical protein